MWLLRVTQLGGCACRSSETSCCPSPVEEAWDALTDPDRLEEWFANDVELEPVPGGRAVFRWDDGEVRHAVVETVEEPERLVLRWEDDGLVELGARRAIPPAPACTSGRPRPSGAVALELRASAAWASGVGAVFGALADPSRRYLVERLAHLGAATPTELASELPIARGRQWRSTWRRSSTRGSSTAPARAGTPSTGADPAPLRDATAWITRVGAQWDERLAALARHVGGEG